ncbi:uncharacterized protein LOC127702691 [Mytilus californianus]|uniref:uncharacterized protein LOC127702691 n=1 Tax=Mytilus californianus TaxID=6549 RepID=UPI002247BC38|nr:uncharacterized protein LOC127702691 [Mytilus californianus]
MAGVLRYAGPQSTPKQALSDQTLPFLKEDQFTDTVLVVEGRKMYINRALLGYASPYFKKMLENAHRSVSSEKKSKAEIRISEKNFPDFIDMLAFLHPGVCRDLTEKMALRLLPLSHEYQMFALKERCEKVLISALKKTKLTDVKGPPQQRNRRDNTPEILLKCIKAADKGMSKAVLTYCLKMFANPGIPLKDLKSSQEISDNTKSKIFESRMDNAAHKLNRVANELDREKHEKEMLKKQLTDKYIAHDRTAFGAGLPGRVLNRSSAYTIPKTDPTQLQCKISHMSFNNRKQTQHIVNDINTLR